MNRQQLLKWKTPSSATYTSNLYNHHLVLSPEIHLFEVMEMDCFLRFDDEELNETGAQWAWNRCQIARLDMIDS